MSHSPDLNWSLGRVRLLATSLVATGRLSALASISVSEFAQKHEATVRTWTYLRAADQLLAVLNEHCESRERALLSWPDFVGLPELREDAAAPVEAASAAAEMEVVRARACKLSEELCETLCDTPLLRVAFEATDSARRTLGRWGYGTVPTSPASVDAGDDAATESDTTTVQRRIRGPIESPLPSAFLRTWSLDSAQPPAFGDRISELVPYMWCVSIREMTAADLCSLTLAEYDGLPLPFYIDFAKQAVDEAGHARHFFEAAVELFDELEGSGDASDELIGAIRAYRATGTGLPVPREGNLYETIWTASLSQRLVIMHHDTEGPAVKSLAERISGELCQRHPPLRRALEIDRYDEISHAAIGARWLRHLYPGTPARREAIHDARQLRGILLLSSFARHGQLSLKDLVARYEARSVSGAAYEIGASP